jgi:hypothetical protein
MIVTNVTKKVDIPHEPGEWMIIKRLSWKQLDEASTVSSMASFERISKLGPDMAATLSKFASGAPSSDAAYDRATVLNQGIAKWSYSDEINPDNIDALDDVTANWAFREIVAMNQPTEQEVKNA